MLAPKRMRKRMGKINRRVLIFRGNALSMRPFKKL
jgi:hypothetical protein